MSHLQLDTGMAMGVNLGMGSPSSGMTPPGIRSRSFTEISGGGVSSPHMGIFPGDSPAFGSGGSGNGMLRGGPQPPPQQMYGNTAATLNLGVQYGNSAFPPQQQTMQMPPPQHQQQIMRQQPHPGHGGAMGPPPAVLGGEMLKPVLNKREN